MSCVDDYKKSGYAAFLSTLPVAQLETTETKIIDHFECTYSRHDGTFVA